MRYTEWSYGGLTVFTIAGLLLQTYWIVLLAVGLMGGVAMAAHLTNRAKRPRKRR